jgi:hypothetical protein
VQERLAGAFFAAGDLLALHIDRGDVVGLQETFAVHRRGAEHFVFADADGDIAVVGGREALVVDPAADVADILLDLMNVLHVGHDHSFSMSR